MPELTVLICIPCIYFPVHDFEHLVSQRTSAPLADAELLILRKTLKYSLKCSGADQRQRLTRTHFHRVSFLVTFLLPFLLPLHFFFSSLCLPLFYSVPFCSVLSNLMYSYEATSPNIGILSVNIDAFNIATVIVIYMLICHAMQVL